MQIVKAYCLEQAVTWIDVDSNDEVHSYVTSITCLH